MSDSACREFYPEERALIEFLKEIWDDDFIEKGFGYSEENDNRINKMQKLFSEMEKVGARKELWEQRDELSNTRRCLHKVCTHIPVTELLTDCDEEIRNVGLEFQEMIERVREVSPELVEGTTTAREVYDRCEEWKKA